MPHGRVLLAALAALVLYGSLYPFDFALPARADVAAFWLDWRLANSIGDVLGNVALFVPWGTVWMWTRVGSTTRALLLAGTSGLALALLAQVLQLGVPARTAQLSDVVWNGMGIACGLAIAALVPRPTLQGDGERRTTALLLALCLAAAWMPLVPSLDWSLVKQHLKALGQFDARQVQDAAIALVLAGFAAELGGRLARRQPVLVALALVGLMLVGRLLVGGHGSTRAWWPAPCWVPAPGSCCTRCPASAATHWPGRSWPPAPRVRWHRSTCGPNPGRWACCPLRRCCAGRCWPTPARWPVN